MSDIMHAELLAALKLAKNTIKYLHGPVAWEIYDKASPEMKVINAAIEKGESGTRADTPTERQWLRDRNAKLREALQDLLDEQNDAPIERHRKRWQASCDNARALLSIPSAVQPTEGQ